MPKIVEDLVPKTLPLGVLQKVLQNLLEEDIAIRDMRTIVETLAEAAARTQEVEALTALVRTALGRSIVQQLYPNGAEMQVMSLDPQLERILLQAIGRARTEAAMSLFIRWPQGRGASRWRPGRFWRNARVRRPMPSSSPVPPSELPAPHPDRSCCGA